MNLDWPPPYTLKRSKRARRVNLRLCPERGLELIVPLQCTDEMALEFLNEQKAWVYKHKALLNPKPTVAKLPEKLELPALEKNWFIRLENISGYKKIKLLEMRNELVLFGENLALEPCLKELKQWLYMLAEKELYLWLRQLSNETGLAFNRLTIRNQSTRWGSCSHDKNISLSVKLLFLPKNLTEYVLVHELCHTKHLDHSARFWGLVKEIIADYEIRKAQLKKTRGHSVFF